MWPKFATLMRPLSPMIELFTLLAICLPLFGGLASLADKRLASIPVWFSFGLSAYLWCLVADGSSFQFATNWLALPAGKSFQVGVRTDLLSASMAAIVTFISGLVQVYSIGYFKAKKHLPRYFSFMGLFTSAMLLLVFSADLLLFTVGWNLVGLASYLLIGYYFEKESAARASTQAILLNKLGDAFLLLGLMGTWVIQKNLFFAGDEQTLTVWPESAWWIPFCLMLAAMVKSAQFPFQVWLPDAMEGPTPVSALLHAATMVVAGVFLLIRVYPLLPNEVLDLTAYVGVGSALVASMLAYFHWDAKRILAWSTVAQIGFMFAAIGFHAPYVAFLHLFTHAFFKAGLFLSAGNSIQQASIDYSGSQHLAQLSGYGSTREKYAFILLLASLIGMPLSIGYLSKEAILASGWAHQSWLVVLLILSGGVTALYMGKYFFHVFGKTASVTTSKTAIWQWLPVALLAAFTLLPLGWAQYGIHAETISFLPIGISVLKAVDAPIWLPVLAIALSVSAFAFAFYSQSKMPITLAKEAKTPSWAASSFLIYDFWLSAFRYGFEVLPRQIAHFDQNWVDRFWRAGGKSVVILGHLVAFVDVKFVDNLVLLIATFSRLGGRIINSFQTASMQRNLAHLIYFVIIFSCLVYWLTS